LENCIGGGRRKEDKNILIELRAEMKVKVTNGPTREHLTQVCFSILPCSLVGPLLPCITVPYRIFIIFSSDPSLPPIADEGEK
jgi:hypothetical protein